VLRCAEVVRECGVWLVEQCAGCLVRVCLCVCVCVCARAAVCVCRALAVVLHSPSGATHARQPQPARQQGRRGPGRRVRVLCRRALPGV
jgi:hypothetical protein